MHLNSIVALSAVAIMACALCVTAAEAGKRQSRSGFEVPVRSDTPSLDGRVLGYPRTCGSTTYQRDSRGIPVGPYCH